MRIFGRIAPRGRCAWRSDKPRNSLRIMLASLVMSEELTLFLSELGRQEAAANTVASYRADLQLFAHWFEATNGEAFGAAAVTPGALPASPRAAPPPARPPSPPGARRQHPRSAGGAAQHRD